MQVSQFFQMFWFEDPVIPDDLRLNHFMGFCVIMFHCNLDNCFHLGDLSLWLYTSIIARYMNLGRLLVKIRLSLQQNRASSVSKKPPDLTRLFGYFYACPWQDIVCAVFTKKCYF